MRRRRGYAINVQLRPGSYVTAFPVAPAMSFVEETYQVIALYGQNELRLVEPGNAAEFSLKTYPGRIIKAKVDSIVWAQGQGQVAQSGMLPQTGAYPQVPGRFPVKFDVDESDRELFLAAGAEGAGAIYTEHVAAIHIIRMVILRVGDDHRLPRAEAALMRRDALLSHRMASSRRRSRRRWRAARSSPRRRRRICRRMC